MHPQTYYATQSPISTPGDYAHLFDNLPDDIDRLCKVVQGIYIHYRGGSMFNYQIPPHRQAEVDTRYMPKILAQIIKLDNRPLTEARPPEKRFVGCCRDAALLLCAMLRHKGIPARTRVGFAAYIRGNTPGFKYDHVVTEYWDAATASWKLVDAEQSEMVIAHNQLDFDVHDIPRDQFLVGGLAWQMIRSKQAKAESFGVDPRDIFKGEWAIRNRLIHDLATLNKVELLLWDTWGWMDMQPKPGKVGLTLLDKVATLTQEGDAAFEQIQALYQNEHFKAPKVVMNYSPIVTWKEVAIQGID